QSDGQPDGQPHGQPYGQPDGHPTASPTAGPTPSPTVCTTVQGGFALTVPDPEEFAENCSNGTDVRVALETSIATIFNGTVTPEDVSVFCVFGQRVDEHRTSNVTIQYDIAAPVGLVDSIRDSAEVLLGPQASSQGLARLVTIISDELSSTAPAAASNAPTEAFGGSEEIAVDHAGNCTSSPAASPAAGPTASPTASPTPTPTPAPTAPPMVQGEFAVTVPDPEKFASDCSSSADMREALQSSIASYMNGTVAPEDVAVFCSIDSGSRLDATVEYEATRRSLAGNVTIDYRIVVLEETAHSVQDSATELLSSQASGQDLARLAALISSALSATAPGASGNAPLQAIGGPAALAVISTQPPTPRPTPLSTPGPTASPGPVPPLAVSSGAMTATGDPHLRNIYGERFDLRRPGKHTLVNIPKGERAERALLHVEAEAVQMGMQCADLYFRELNMTGVWVEATWSGGLHFHALDVSYGTSKWKHVGKVDVKVAHGRTREGIQYLNVYIKHLDRAGFAVGGLLGEDDHTQATMASRACVQRHSVSLLEFSR
ncbi:unnamed protein product, partial [Prorocentrum cordatum]